MSINKKLENIRKTAYHKDIRRTISGTLNRFIAIFVIVALGAGVFAGLSATSRDMELTADNYCNNSDMMDLRLVSTLGLTDDDIDVISKIEGVKAVMAGYFSDQLTKVGSSEEVVRIHSLPSNLRDDNEAYINRPALIEGRLPAVSNECVVGVSSVGKGGLEIGDTLSIVDDGSLSDTLRYSEYKVVGFVNSSYYLAFTLGTSSIGNGEVSMFIYVPERSFCVGVYTDVYMTIDGADELNCFSDEYGELVDNVSEKLESIAAEREALRYDEVVADANAQLEEAKQEYYDAENEAKRQFANAYLQIVNGKKELEEGQAQLDEAKLQLDEQWSYYEELNELYENSLDDYNNDEEAFRSTIEQFGSEAWDYYIQNRDNIDFDELPEDLAQSIVAIDLFLSSFSEEEREQIIEAVASGSIENAEEIFSVSKEALDSYYAQLISSQKEYEDGKARLAEGTVALNRGWQEYIDAKADAEQQLADAWEQILEAEVKISELQNPNWYILDRTMNYGFANFRSDAGRMRSLATVFPVMFFLVAALVALTTMTRMVEEQRIVIGTYKALGYGNIRIIWKYLVYALIASIAGSLFGITICFKALPSVVWAAYSMLYTAPDFVTPFHLDIAAAATLVMCTSTLLSTYAACRSVLHEQPSTLMQPKAPKPGKRIFLERIGFIWKHHKFTTKVTCRNIFRYKKRLIMTLFGIAGCTALLVVGFGIKDSVSGIIHNQFDTIYKYDTLIDSSGEELSDRVVDVLDDASNFEKWMRAGQKSISLNAGDESITGYVLVPESSSRFADFTELRERASGKSVAFDSDSCVIAEKAAKLLNVGIGDTVSFEYADGESAEVTITGITENYVYLYLYIAPQLYEKVTGAPIELNEIMADTSAVSSTERQALSQKLLKLSGINTVSFTEDISSTFDSMIDSLNMVVLVLIVCAAALAFVVLYNLTNINITERTRELATIKVLGFFDHEVSSYIYRETVILSIIGCILGLGLGVILHSFVITTVEVEMVMFGRDISSRSFAYSAALTMLFTFIVSFVMNGRLKKIDMVESLKSVD